MKILVMILLTYMSFAFAAKKGQTLRSKIGPTFNSPTEHNGSLYFLATTGVLYKSNYKIDSVEKLFVGKHSTVADIVIHNDKIYFGEGLHTTTTATLYEFDIKTKKITNKITLPGHLEKKVLIINETLYISSGPGGFHAIDIKTFKKKWSVTKVGKKILHVDSTPINYKDNVCFSSIYTYRAIVCVNAISGKYDFSIVLKRAPKGDISLYKNYLYGFATEANMKNANFKVKSTFYSIDLDKKKIQAKKELRGYNLFAPMQMEDEKVMVNISTGDMLYMNIKTGGIGYIADFPEPFVSSPFKMGKSLCSIGIMGKLVCFEEKKKKFIMSKDKRYFETVVGTVGKAINGKIYLPSRTGFLII
jgi:outer membrane protein assembly factor BamB